MSETIEALISALRDRTSLAVDGRGNAYPEPDIICHEAADAIERLTRERDEAKENAAICVVELRGWREKAETAEAEFSVARAELAVARNAALEEAANVADGFRCGGCGMDGKAGAAIRALKTEA